MGEADQSYDKDWNPLTDRSGNPIGSNDVARFPKKPLYDWRGKRYDGPVYDSGGRLIRKRASSGYSSSWGSSSGGGGGGVGSGLGSGGGEQILAWIVFALIGFVFYLLFQIVKFYFSSIVKGFQSLFAGNIAKALLYFAVPAASALLLLLGIWFYEPVPAKLALQQYTRDQAEIIIKNPRQAINIRRITWGIEYFKGCNQLCDDYVVSKYEIENIYDAVFHIEVKNCRLLSDDLRVKNIMPGEKYQFYCPQKSKEKSHVVFPPPCVEIKKIGSFEIDALAQVCVNNFTGTENKLIEAILTPDATRALPTLGTVVVTAQSVNLRAGPGAEFRIVGYAYEGDELPLYGKNEDGSWLKIDSSGKTWIAASLVEHSNDDKGFGFTPTPTKTPLGYVVVVPSSVYLRFGPGTDFKIVGYAYKGDELPVYGKSEDGSWFQIDTLGHTWIANSIVDFDGDAEKLPILPTATSTIQPQ